MCVWSASPENGVSDRRTGSETGDSVASNNALGCASNFKS